MKKQITTDTDQILIKVADQINLASDKNLNDRIGMTLACYYLWNIKKNSSLKTPGDVLGYVTGRDNCQFGCEAVDDLCMFFEENPDSWKNLVAMKPDYSEEELAACIIESRKFESGIINRIPYGLGLLIDGLLDIKRGDKVYQINCREGEYLIESIGRHKGVTYAGYEEDSRARMMGSIIADVKGLSPITFENDIYTEDANKILANCFTDSETFLPRTVIEGELEDIWPGFPVESSENWKTCGMAAKRVENGGKAVAIVMGGELTLKNYIKARKHMCDSGCIEGVICLADKSYDTTWINPYIVIFSQGNKKIKFLDASSISVPERIKGKRVNVLTQENVEEILRKYNGKNDAVVVSVKEVAQNDYNLNPSRYIDKPEEASNTVELRQFIRGVTRGMTLSAAEMDELISEDSEGEKCIMPAGIADGVVSSKLYYNGPIKKSCKNFAIPRNLLISKTGNPFKIAIVFERHLCIGNTYIISLDTTKISPEYVKCYLSSKQGQAELGRFASGSGALMISVPNLYKIRIPIYEKKKQDKLNKRAEEIVGDLEKIYKQIADTREEIDSLFE